MSMNTLLSKQFRRFVLVAIPLLACPVASAVDIADAPTFLLTGSVPPNMFLTLDTSGSMNWAYVPDGLNDETTTRKFRAASYNPLYYNPKTTYKQPQNAGGALAPYYKSTATNKDWTSTLLDGFCNASSSQTINLDNGYRVTTQLTRPTSSTCSGGSNSTSRHPDADSGSGKIFSNSDSNTRGYYYLWYADATKGGRQGSTTWSSTPPLPGGCTATDRTDDDCYVYVQVASSHDITAGTSTAAQKANFATWYAFHRTRMLTTMTGLNLAMEEVPQSTRVAWQTFGACNDLSSWSCAGRTKNYSNKLLPFTDTHRSDFYNWQFDFKGAHSGESVEGTSCLAKDTAIRTFATPLVCYTHRVGDYYQNGTTTSWPLADNPALAVNASTNPERACRKNFHVLFTDGMWNTLDESKILPLINGDADDGSTITQLPDGRAFPCTAADCNSTSHYQSGHPYTNHSTVTHTLADVAFYYWATDLRPGANDNATDCTGSTCNQVLPYWGDKSGTTAENYWNPANDPATWQHVTNHVIGLGLTSTLVPQAGWTPTPFPTWKDGTTTCDSGTAPTGTGGYCDLVQTSNAANWPTPVKNTGTSSSEANVYDLWHAAINSRGQFFSADTSEQLGESFKKIINSIKDATPSSAGLTTNTSSIELNTVIFLASFDSTTWAGSLKAIPISNQGVLDTANPKWDAATKIPTTRNILTLNDSNRSGVNFDCASISSNQQTALGMGTPPTCSSNLVNWLRGSNANEEQNGGTLRNRPLSGGKTLVLGDTVSSTPYYVYRDNLGYASLPVGTPGQSTYDNFVSSKPSIPMIYMGANDGMLHGFRADTDDPDSGKELFAFIPAAAYGNLASLTSQSYSHRFFVDGPPNVGDICVSPCTAVTDWKTYLISGLGAGGKSVFGLDISDPTAFTSGHVKWEFDATGDDADATTGLPPGNGTSDGDLGFTFGQPQIARLNNGQWAAIFGNGYNSTNGKSVLYIVDLESGDLIRKLVAGNGPDNGLSTTVLYDSNNDKIVDYVYAGDLHGNLWKFNLSTNDETTWSVANTGLPLFTAADGSGNAQAITAPPRIGAHPNGGNLIYFGTGRYLSSTDVTDAELAKVHSFYAIWDKPSLSGTIPRTSLLEQTITQTTNEFGLSVRESTNTAPNWSSHYGWYMDLPSTGERVVSPALLKENRAIFVTIVPSNDPCTPGGESWLMELTAASGARTLTSVFDFNNDQVFDDSDLLASGNAASGIKLENIGIATTPAWLTTQVSDTLAFKVTCGTTGECTTVSNQKGGGCNCIGGIWTGGACGALSGTSCVGGGGTPKRIHWQQIM